jgi:hypothetical protein
VNANKQDAGGLPALPVHCKTWPSGQKLYTADQMRAYGEQCYAMGAADVASYEQTLRNFGRNGEQCRAASGDVVAWIRPDGVTTSDAALMRHWEAQGLQFEPLVRALSRGVPEPKVGIQFEVLDRLPGQPADEVWLMQGGKCLGKFKVDAAIAAQRKEGE